MFKSLEDELIAARTYNGHTYESSLELNACMNGFVAGRNQIINDILKAINDEKFTVSSYIPGEAPYNMSVVSTEKLERFLIEKKG